MNRTNQQIHFDETHPSDEEMAKYSIRGTDYEGSFRIYKSKNPDSGYTLTIVNEEDMLCMYVFCNLLMFSENIRKEWFSSSSVSFH